MNRPVKWIVTALVIVLVLAGVNYFVGFPVYATQYLFAKNINQNDLVVCPYVEDPKIYVCNVKLGQEFVLSDFFQEKVAGRLAERIGGCWRENKSTDSSFAEVSRVVYFKKGSYLAGIDKAEIFVAKKVGKTTFRIDQCCGYCYPIEAKIKIVK